MRAVADNDVLLKGSCYLLLSRLMATVSGEGSVGVLGASRFVVPKWIARAKLNGNPETAQEQFSRFIDENELIEPTAEEQKTAALLEVTAQRLGLSLDAGESQLIATVISRPLPWLLTGDKRAIESVEAILASEQYLAVLAGKVRCIEQLVSVLVDVEGVNTVRKHICAEPFVDKTLSICFSCTSPDSDNCEALDGLKSYISDLRSRASRVLAT